MVGSGDSVTLITRPRRFGKTLTMSMIECFFSLNYHEKGEKLFRNLNIWKEPYYQQLQGTYPVINLTFSSVKEVNFDEAKTKIYNILINLFNEHKYLLEGDFLSETERLLFTAIRPNMKEAVATDAIHQLSLFLYRYYRKKVRLTSKYTYTLAITNVETLCMFHDIVKAWFTPAGKSSSKFLKALLSNDVESMNYYMNEISLKTFSSFDTGKQSSQKEPERFYHGFVLGLVVELQDEYVIISNVESGGGRYDVMLKPLEKNRKAYLLRKWNKLCYNKFWFSKIEKIVLLLM